jgi:signal transduction histidine kinase
VDRVAQSEEAGAILVWDQAVESLEQLGLPAEEPAGLATAIARLTSARWMLLPNDKGGWIEIRDGGSRVRSGGPRLSRCLDFGVFHSIPTERLVRIDSSAMERSPRLVCSGLYEILVYRDSPRWKGLAILGLSNPLRADPNLLETLFRAWFAIESLRARLHLCEEDRHWSRIGREAACVAHDMRHHLTLAGLELERCASQGHSDGREGIRRAVTALAGARELCDRSVAGAEPVPRSERVRLLDLLRAEGQIATRHSRRGHRTKVAVRGPVELEVCADRVLLGRLVRNLVLNALEATPEGREVEVGAEIVPSGEVSVSVRDSGRGMPGEEIAQLLRFGRSGSGGAGVGMASVEACARALAVTLEIGSSPGAGTQVRFRLRPWGSDA